MGLFDFGGSQSSSRSTSQSNSFDNLDAFGFNFGFDNSFSSSQSGGSSFDRSAGASDQRIAFEEVFANLFGNASGAAGRVAANSGNVTGAANMLFNAGGGILESLSGGGAGAEFLEERLANRDGLADQQISQLGDDLGTFLSEIANPAITSGGVAAGSLGGSRGEVQRGIATGKAADAFTRGATDIRVRDQAARDSIAGQLMNSEAERGGMALSALPQLFGLAEAGSMAELSPFMMLSQILGPAQALTSSRSSSEGGSQQFSQALAEALGINLGMDQTTGRAASQSRSDSRSDSRSLSLGFS